MQPLSAQSFTTSPLFLTNYTHRCHTPCLFAQCSAEPEHLLAVREPEDSQQ